MSAGEYDVIAVGGGSNNLIAACYLAKAGKKVLVLEGQPWLGGGVASTEYTAGGFQHERHGSVHAKILANPLITDDELGLQSRHGLRYVRPADSYGAIFEDGSWLGISRNRERTLASLAATVPEDVEAFCAFANFAAEVTALLVPGFFRPPEPFGAIIAELEGSSVGQRVARMMMQSAYDVICEHVASDKLRVALCRLVAELLLIHPDEKGTGLFAVVAVGYAEGFGFGFPRGAGAGFTQSLLDCLVALGGDVVSSTHVDEVLVRGGRARGVRTDGGETILANDAVIAAFHPHRLSEIVPRLDSKLIADAKRVQPSTYTGFVVHAALRTPLRFINDMANDCAMVTVGAANLRDTIESFDRLKRGRLSEKPALWSTTLPDPDRAPAGKGVLHCYCMTAYSLESGGPDGWRERGDAYGAAILARLGEFIHPLQLEAGSEPHFATPLDHERDSPSFTGGDLNSSGMFVHQMGSFRPTAALSQFSVPGAEGLYLSGPAMHPGGGITGGGRATAIKVMDDLGIRFHEVVAPISGANSDSRTRVVGR